MAALVTIPAWLPFDTRRLSSRHDASAAYVGVVENERNLNNKISRGGFTAAFLLQCLEAIGADAVRL